jgi:hypothetical protein
MPESGTIHGRLKGKFLSVHTVAAYGSVEV